MPSNERRAKMTKCECGFPAHAQGYCDRCYRRKRRNGTLKAVRKTMSRKGICGGPECKRKIYARGMCGAHYVQVIRGKPLTVIQGRGAYAIEANEAASSATYERVEREIADGKRCHCGLLKPCPGHETISLDWHASRRNGASGGDSW